MTSPDNAVPPADWVRELVHIMARLRAPNGCPWDLEQDHVTLKKHLIEEAYELCDAIDEQDDHQLADELGDVLLQVVFHCQIAAETQRFDLQQVARILCEKLIRRHPHVFGEAAVADAAGVVEQWEAIKRQERTGQRRPSVLDGIPRGLPALAQAEKIQKKAAKVGFDWPEVEGVIAKLEEELAELKEAVRREQAEEVREELGDLLFSIVNLARHRHESAEELLRAAVRKFDRRFRHVEGAVTQSGRPFSEYQLAELDALWEQAKALERQPGPASA